MDANQRVGDADRDAAVSSLRDHTTAGRLALDEFDERMSQALQAKTRSDIEVLFVDLPGGPPGQHRPELSIVPLTDKKALAKRSPPKNHAEVLRIGGIVVVWLVFFAGVMFEMFPWWLFWIPSIATGAIAGDDTPKKKKNKPKELD